MFALRTAGGMASRHDLLSFNLCMTWVSAFHYCCVNNLSFTTHLFHVLARRLRGCWMSPRTKEAVQSHLENCDLSSGLGTPLPYEQKTNIPSCARGAAVSCPTEWPTLESSIWYTIQKELSSSHQEGRYYKERQNGDRERSHLLPSSQEPCCCMIEDEQRRGQLLFRIRETSKTYCSRRKQWSMSLNKPSSTLRQEILPYFIENDRWDQLFIYSTEYRSTVYKVYGTVL